MNRTQIVLLCVLLTAGLLAAGACFSSESRQPFTIAWNYDTSGYLETCGCSAHQLGGLGRRGTKIAELRKQGPVLAIEGAHSVADQGEFQLFKGLTIVSALNTMDYSALQLGVREAQHGVEGLTRIKEQAQFPVFSANLLTDGEPFADTHVVTEIAGTKVGITGVSQPELVTFELPTGVAFGDPAEALDAALAALKGADMRIVALEGEETWLAAMITQFKGRADLFLTGNRAEGTANLEFDPAGPRLNSYDRGRYMGLVTVDPAPDGFALTGTNVQLSDQLTDLPDIKALLDNDYKPKLKDMFFATFKQDLTQLFMPPEYCAECHQQEYETYTQTGHYIAMQTLVDKNQTYNPDCMSCHLTYDPKEDKIYSMNCVVCHTNITEDHVWQAMEGDDKVIRPETPVTTYTYDWCYRCHDPLNSSEFEAHWPQYVNKIYHGGDLEPAKQAAEEMGINMTDPPPAH